MQQVVVNGVPAVVREIARKLLILLQPPVQGRGRLDDPRVCRDKVHMVPVVPGNLAVIADVHSDGIARAIMHVVVRHLDACAAVHVNPAATVVNTPPAEIPDVVVVDEMVADPLVVQAGPDHAHSIALGLGDVAAQHLAGVGVVAQVRADFGIAQVAGRNGAVARPGDHDRPAPEISDSQARDTHVLNPPVLVRLPLEHEGRLESRDHHLPLCLWVVPRGHEVEGLRVRVHAPLARRVQLLEDPAQVEWIALGQHIHAPHGLHDALVGVDTLHRTVLGLVVQGIVKHHPRAFRVGPALWVQVTLLVTELGLRVRLHHRPVLQEPAGAGVFRVEVGHPCPGHELPVAVQFAEVEIGQIQLGQVRLEDPVAPGPPAGDHAAAGESHRIALAFDREAGIRGSKLHRRGQGVVSLQEHNAHRLAGFAGIPCDFQRGFERCQRAVLGILAGLTKLPAPGVIPGGGDIQRQGPISGICRNQYEHQKYDPERTRHGGVTSEYGVGPAGVCP